MCPGWGVGGGEGCNAYGADRGSSPIGCNTIVGSTFRCSARDLARLGYLWLQQGQMGEEAAHPRAVDKTGDDTIQTHRRQHPCKLRLHLLDQRRRGRHPRGHLRLKGAQHQRLLRRPKPRPRRGEDGKRQPTERAARRVRQRTPRQNSEVNQALASGRARLFYPSCLEDDRELAVYLVVRIECEAIRSALGCSELLVYSSNVFELIQC